MKQKELFDHSEKLFFAFILMLGMGLISAELFRIAFLPSSSRAVAIPVVPTNLQAESQDTMSTSVVEWYDD